MTANQPDVAAIAKGLTKAQKWVIEIATERPSAAYGPDAWEIAPGSSRKRLEALGVLREREWRGLTGRARRGYALTPLGLAVRAYLSPSTVQERKG